MKIIYKIGFLAVLICFFFSCDSRREQEEKADIRLKHIELLIRNSSLNAAKIEGSAVPPASIYVLPMPDNEIEFGNR